MPRSFRSSRVDFAPLSQYGHEDGGTARSRRTRFVRRDRAGGASCPGPKLLDDADLQARLVTGTSSTVSLEQYRKLGAVLHEAQAQNQTKTVMITSALPHEGKTLTVVNLALTLSESYARRVLVIDADLRCAVSAHHSGYPERSRAERSPSSTVSTSSHSPRCRAV